KLKAAGEKLLERVVKEFGTLKHPSHGTLGSLARNHLAAIRKPVTVGKPAPDFHAENFESKVIRLSDFRGKVVLLDFWASAFLPCQAMYGYERGLVKRMAGKPFELLGVNSDTDWPALQKSLKAEKITWQSFWDGGNIGGPIATRYDVDLWPTLVLIDHKGIV